MNHLINNSPIIANDSQIKVLQQLGKQIFEKTDEVINLLAGNGIGARIAKSKKNVFLSPYFDRLENHLLPMMNEDGTIDGKLLNDFFKSKHKMYSMLFNIPNEPVNLIDYSNLFVEETKQLFSLFMGNSS